MKAIYTLLLFAWFVNTTHSQKKEICVSDEISLEEQNEISKCLFQNKAKKARNINSKILISNKNVANRFLVKRNLTKKTTRKKTTVSTVSNMDCNGVAVNKVNTALSTISAKDLAAHMANKKEFFEFDEVEQIPLFEGCERSSYDDDLYCFNANMSNYISMNLDDLDEIESSNAVEVVQISFIIDKQGKIKDVLTKGLEKEKRIHSQIVALIQDMSEFIPAKNKGQNVSVRYHFEIKLSAI